MWKQKHNSWCFHNLIIIFILKCDFLLLLAENYLEIAIAFFAFLRVVFALYPTSKGTKVFGYIDDLLAWIVQGDKKKKK